MDLSNVEIFLAVTETSSITRAAKVLGRVPSNVSVRVQQLEQQLDVTLFSRDGKKMTLTRQGETFLTYARRLLALAAEARSAVRPLSPSGSLRVGTMESTAASRLPEVLAAFRTRWPDVSLRLTMGPTRELAQAVLAEELDCALIARPSEALKREDEVLGIDLSDLVSQTVYVEDVMLVIPAGHPAIRTAADLRVDALVALEPGCTYRRIAEHWSKSASDLKVVELNSYHAIAASVAAGNAVGVMPKSVFDLLQRPAGSTTYALASVDTLLVQRQGDQSPALRAFAETLHARAPAR